MTTAEMKMREALRSAGMPQDKINDLVGLWGIVLTDAADKWWLQTWDNRTSLTARTLAEDDAGLRRMLAESIRDYGGRVWRGIEQDESTLDEFRTMLVDYFLADIPEEKQYDVHGIVVDQLLINGTDSESLENIVEGWLWTFPSDFRENTVEAKTPDILLALWTINRHAKRLRDCAAVAYDENNHPEATACRRRKEQVYHAKTTALVMLVDAGVVKISHRSEDCRYISIEGNGYKFHCPLAGWLCVLPDDLPVIEFDGLVEAKSKSANEMSVSEAWKTVAHYIAVATEQQIERANRIQVVCADPANSSYWTKNDIGVEEEMFAVEDENCGDDDWDDE